MWGLQRMHTWTGESRFTTISFWPESCGLNQGSWLLLLLELHGAGLPVLIKRPSRGDQLLKLKLRDMLSCTV